MTVTAVKVSDILAAGFVKMAGPTDAPFGCYVRGHLSIIHYSHSGEFAFSNGEKEVYIKSLAEFRLLVSVFFPFPDKQ